MSQLLQSVPALHCSSEGLCVDEVLHHTLEERERLVDIHLWGRGGEYDVCVHMSMCGFLSICVCVCVLTMYMYVCMYCTCTMYDCVKRVK